MATLRAQNRHHVHTILIPEHIKIEVFTAFIAVKTSILYTQSKTKVPLGERGV